jgi:hypothetical protein
MIFWVEATCLLCPEDGGIIFLRNTGNHLRDYMVSNQMTVVWTLTAVKSSNSSKSTLHTKSPTIFTVAQTYYRPWCCSCFRSWHLVDWDSKDLRNVSNTGQFYTVPSPKKQYQLSRSECLKLSYTWFAGYKVGYDIKITNSMEQSPS